MVRSGLNVIIVQLAPIKLVVISGCKQILGRFGGSCETWEGLLHFGQKFMTPSTKKGVNMHTKL